ncbi:hypothetical protein [Nafulsella turpanensis]|uniref:hypothetical protein n=1 Tax=Nafulsella turpanensis TaxID=1265690 RepID=UPI0003723B42|nr:hypothetical protein [Nafulsella turpanensis]
MKQLILITLSAIIFSGCKVSKPISDVSTQLKEVSVRQRSYKLSIGERTAFDTLHLEELMNGHPVTHVDKKTGISITHQLKGRELHASVQVPAIEKEIIVADTTTIITNDRKVVVEEEKGFFEKLSDHFSFLVWVLIIGLVLSFVFRLLKVFFFPLS